MKVSHWLTIGGWLATFLLGVVATVIVQRFTRKRSILAWTVLSENTIFPREASIDLDVPLRVDDDGNDQESLSVVNVRLGSGGNEVIKDFNAVVTMNPAAEILRARLLNDLGEFSNHVSIGSSSNRLDIKFDYLNPEVRDVRLELLIGGYEVGSTAVDLSAPGVVLQRREAAQWDIQVSFVKSLALSIMGVRYDPMVSPLREIADELRHLNRYVVAESARRSPTIARRDETLRTDRPSAGDRTPSRSEDSHEWRFLRGFMGKKLPHRQRHANEFEGGALAGISRKNRLHRQLCRMQQEGSSSYDEGQHTVLRKRRS